MRRVITGLVAIFSALTIGLVTAPAAHADSRTNWASKTWRVSHLTGDLDIQIWITTYQDNNNTVIGAIGRMRLIDRGGVKSASIDVKALRFAANNVTIVRNTTRNWEPLDAPGDEVYGDTNDALNYNYSNVRNSVDGTDIWANVSFTVHWGDDVVIEYGGVNSQLLGPITCSGGFIGACGEVERTIPT